MDKNKYRVSVSFSCDIEAFNPAEATRIMSYDLDRYEKLSGLRLFVSEVQTSSYVEDKSNPAQGSSDIA